jgi:ABC-type transport system substrate-binding protein
VPSVAVALPEVSADGKTWTIKIRPGIYFADDPAFKGKKRELTAGDFVYAWKRILDPKMRSPALAVFEGKLSGIAAPIAAAKKPEPDSITMRRSKAFRRSTGTRSGSSSINPSIRCCPT